MERVELACHTCFSPNKGLGKPQKWIYEAINKGQEAMAVTDIDSVGAFGLLNRIQSRYDPEVKIIYGMEMPVYVSPLEQGMEKSYISLLIQNENGRKNLYRLIYEKEAENEVLALDRILAKRDGLLIGSGREEGPLQIFLRNFEKNGFPSMEEAAGHAFVKDLLKAMDYIEIPPGCEKSLALLLLKIAKENDILPVAVGGPCCTDEESFEAYKLLYKQETEGYKASCQYVLSGTADFLKAFDYLEENLAEEIVVVNSNKIADACEQISPFSNQLLFPKIEDQDRILREICEEALASRNLTGNTKYEERLEWELNAIELTASAFVFLQLRDIINRLGLKPFEIGNRGCVGNSLVAYLCGLHEIDPVKVKLSPYFFFGLNGDKFPDIVLNFSETVQEKVKEAYKSVAGVKDTIGVIHPHFLSKKEMLQRLDDLSAIEDLEKQDEIMDVLSETITGMEWDPGKILLVPENMDIAECIPIHNIHTKEESRIAAGVSYFNIDHMLMKMDIMRHDGLGLLKDLSDATGIDPRSISLRDREVLAMFAVEEGKEPLCAGIAEFQDAFMYNALKVSHPRSFDDLASLIALAHGTGTWFHAENEIKEGHRTSEMPATRDDVYDVLKAYGMDDNMAFILAEEVRKGKVSRNRGSEWEKYRDELVKKGVPNKFLTSCENIRYMFPRAHAYAYMLMAWRLAWFKLHYPKEYDMLLT